MTYTRKGGKVGATIRPKQQQVQQQQQVRERREVFPVEAGLKSDATIKQYTWHFDAFLKWVRRLKHADITSEKLLQFDHDRLERLIIDYLKYLDKERHQRPSSINSSMCAIFHFCRVNAYWLNKDRVSMFIPDDEDHEEDRPYTHKEIARLLKESDPRFRVVFLLLANGLRIGAVPQLEMRDLIALPIPTKEDERPQKIYKLKVYERSKKGKYYTFVTPECAKAIDDYIAFRNKNAKEGVTAGVGDSPLIREQFDLFNHPHDRSLAIPKKMSQSSLEKTIERIVKRAGIDNTNVMLTHGFRKFAITQMIEADVDYSIREYLVGHRHSRGLDTNYERLSDIKKLQRWKKAINNLTIDKAFRLERELEIIEGETAQKIALLESSSKKQEGVIEMLKDRLRGAGLWDSCD